MFKIEYQVSEECVSCGSVEAMIEFASPNAKDMCVFCTGEE